MTTEQLKAQYDYAVKRYKAAEDVINRPYAYIGQNDFDSVCKSNEEKWQYWQSLVNSEPTISEMETVEADWPDEDEIHKWIVSHGYYGSCTTEYYEGLQEGIEWLKQRMKQK